MTNELKEPGWSPPEIPGLVRKRGKKAAESAPVSDDRPAATTVVEQPAQQAPDNSPPAKAAPRPSQNGTVVSPGPVATEALQDRADSNQGAVELDPAKAHEDLMQCLAYAKTLTQKLQAAADSYYVMCDYMSASDVQPYIPIVDGIMRALDSMDPALVGKIIDTQAQQIIEGWVALAGVANNAVNICKLLTQASRAQILDNELREQWNAEGDMEKRL